MNDAALSNVIQDLPHGRSFSEAIAMLGVTPEYVKSISENEADQIPFPSDVKSVVVKDSEIHGKGLFAVSEFKKGQIIAPARINGKRTPAGRFTNHGSVPNALGVMIENEDVYLVAASDIGAGAEILSDYYLNYVNSRPRTEQRFIDIARDLFPPDLDEVGIAFTNPLEVREKIHRLEDALLAMPSRMQMPTTHRFINGLYAREIFIPKGMLLTGKIHRGANISIMSKGDKLVLTEDGAMRVKAPYATISRPGIKRVGYALEDSIWTTIHATTERDLKKLDQELFCETYEGIKFDESEIMTLSTVEG